MTKRNDAPTWRNISLRNNPEALEGQVFLGHENLTYPGEKWLFSFELGPILGDVRSFSGGPMFITQDVTCVVVTRP